MFKNMKPVPKAIIVGLLFSGIGYGLYKWMDSDSFAKLAGKSSTPEVAVSAPPPVAAAPAPQASKSLIPSFGGGSLGSSNNPLKVSIVSFHGYAPGLVANGNSLTTKSGSIYSQMGANVQFVIQDDIPTLATIFEAKTAHCAWRTSDFWAQEQPNLRNAKLDGRAVMVVDNTQGADAIIARDPAIKSVEDLAGRTVALLQFTPSHGMVIDAIDNSAMSAKKKSSVRYVFIQAEEGTAGVRAAFESGKVDAAALWDPDLSLALRAGGKVIYSTKTASNLIYDVMVCDSRILNTADGAEAVNKFVAGWMAGVKHSKANPDVAVEALVETEEFFKLLAQKEGKQFVKSLFGNLVWTGLDDNARILGLIGGTNHYERVYKQFDVIYRKAGALANPNSPVIAPQDSFDYRFVKSLLANDAQAQAAAAQPTTTFTESGLRQAQSKGAALTKPVTINFTTGSAELTARSKKTIDEEMVPFIENVGAAYIEISGNTDSTGSQSVNQSLSERRAAVVRDYLVSQWEFQPNRFKVVGNGSDKPICKENNLAAEGVSLDVCRHLNRSTRLGVYGQ